MSVYFAAAGGYGRCAGCGYHLERQSCQCGDEWAIFTAALRQVAVDGLVHQEHMRPLIRNRIDSKAIGRLYRRAKAEGLIEFAGKEPSTDVQGRNTHHDSPIYKLRDAA